MPRVYLPVQNRNIQAAEGETLLQALRRGGVYPDAPCGGSGACGKCRVRVDGAETLACQTLILRDMTVELPGSAPLRVLNGGISASYRVDPLCPGTLIALDIGTTSLVCFLLDGSTGEELAGAGAANPQAAFGADVISRIRAALAGEDLTGCIRQAVESLIRAVCVQANVAPEEIGVVSVVGNPAMQQLFLGVSVENLAQVPFAPALTEAKATPCAQLLPLCPNARLLTVPDISGYVGADTLACLLATELYLREDITLLVDIGTNGELVLGNRDRMIACATAAGPALEGTNIRFGMRAQEGAIDRVWVENGRMKCAAIGGGRAVGICGSGLIDAVAAALRLGLLDRRGRIQTQERTVSLTEDIYLTQEDIRQVQLAKGAIHAGIRLMAARLGIGLDAIQRVQLAGAFGSFIDPASACRMGLLPEELLGRIEAVGNAAGSGAKLLALDQKLLPLTGELTERIEFLALSGQKEFPRAFAKAMLFREEAP